MLRCWASSLGNCDGMSGEHVVSNVIFKSLCSCPVYIDGVKRIRNGLPTANAEKANILCRNHNSTLSPLDSVIGEIAIFLAKGNDERFEETLYIEGEKLERWAFKTLVNFMAAGWLSDKKYKPSKNIVEIIYGLKSPSKYIGIYSVDGIDPHFKPNGGVTVIPVYIDCYNDSIVGGAYISVHGLTFFVCINEYLGLTFSKGSYKILKTAFKNKQHLYRPRAITVDRKRGKKLVIGIAWGDVLTYQDGSNARYQDVINYYESLKK